MSQPGTGSFEQAILNSSFNPNTGLQQTEVMGNDGTGSRQIKVNTDGTLATPLPTGGA